MKAKLVKESLNEFNQSYDDSISFYSNVKNMQPELLVFQRGENTEENSQDVLPLYFGEKEANRIKKYLADRWSARELGILEANSNEYASSFLLDVAYGIILKSDMTHEFDISYELQKIDEPLKRAIIRLSNSGKTEDIPLKASKKLIQDFGPAEFHLVIDDMSQMAAIMDSYDDATPSVLIYSK